MCHHITESCATAQDIFVSTFFFFFDGLGKEWNHSQSTFEEANIYIGDYSNLGPKYS